MFFLMLYKETHKVFIPMLETIEKQIFTSGPHHVLCEPLLFIGFAVFGLLPSMP